MHISQWCIRNALFRFPLPICDSLSLFGQDNIIKKHQYRGYRMDWHTYALASHLFTTTHYRNQGCLKVLLQWKSTSVYTSWTYSTYHLELAMGTFMRHFVSSCLVCHTSDSPCGVWGCGWTTCLLHDSPLFGSHFKMSWYVSDISYTYYYFLPRFTVSCMKLMIFVLFNNLFIYQVLCTLIYRSRSLYSFLLEKIYLNSYSKIHGAR